MSGKILNPARQEMLIKAVCEFEAVACCLMSESDVASLMLMEDAPRIDDFPPGKEREYMRAVANFVLKITEEPK